MKKISSLVRLLILLLLVPLIFASFKGNNICLAKDEETVVIGLDTDFPPMGFIGEKNEIIGFDIDLAKAVGREMGLKIETQPINWDAKEMELKSGKVDCIWNGLTYSEERNENMTLTRAYMKTKPVVVIKSDAGINCLEDLSGKTVCLQKGALAQESLIASDVCKNAKEVFYLETMLDCLNEVKLGKVTAAVVDEVIARYYLKIDDSGSNFRILEKEISAEDYVIGFAKGNERLKNIIEEGLDRIVKSGEAARISEKWFGKDLVCFSKEDQSTEKKFTERSKGDNNVFSGLFEGLLITLKLFSVCILFSVPLGLLICLIRRRNIKILNIIIDLYTLLIRGTPLLLQIFFIFYGLPLLFPIIKINNRFLAGSVAFVVNYAAYFSEIFRGGINSIPIGQWEAIKVLRIPKFKATKKIIIPQSLKASLPSICNEAITLVKDTALIFTIGIIDLLSATKNIVNTSANVSVYGITAVIYLILCFILSSIFKKLEQKFNYKS